MKCDYFTLPGVQILFWLIDVMGESFVRMEIECEQVDKLLSTEEKHWSDVKLEREAE